jgi:hypothetical protein
MDENSHFYSEFHGAGLVALWFAQELSADIVSKASRGIDGNKRFGGVDVYHPSMLVQDVTGRWGYSPMDSLRFQITELARDVRALREMFEADQRDPR